ncbi:NnrS family protein, partial [Ferrovibrio sp.]|uniref:NnrS family protein n=1 Tax=Ferrovibrio sp. TaxID=1917215 RepID=UPI0025BC2148
FFLFAGLQASVYILLWVAAWFFGMPLAMAPKPELWHGHAMVFGFASAALAGFLLTAVPNWTETPPVRGWRLGMLAGLWLAARILALWPGAIEAGVFTLADLAFWPLLASLVGPGILRRNAKRNGVFVVILAALFLADLGWHLEALGVGQFGHAGLYGALGLFALMVAIIGGRIVPAFTVNGMRAAGRPMQIVPRPWLDRCALFTLAAGLIAELAAAPAGLQAALFAIAALLHLRRFLLWQFWRTWRVPLIWSLHLGYAWLVIGIALKALAALDLIPLKVAPHALGAGCVGMMVLAVMTRASLGHSGRPLVAPASAVAAYGLVGLGAAGRVAAAFDLGAMTYWLTAGAGILWATGFLVFVIGYLPILVKPRADGRPG